MPESTVNESQDPSGLPESDAELVQESGAKRATVVASDIVREGTQIVVEAPSSWPSLPLEEMWRYRELLYFFIWRDIKVRYKQTVLGALWSVIPPIINVIVMTIVFGRFIGMDKHTGDTPYPVFLLAGLLPWNFFAQAVGSSGRSVAGAGNMVSKVYFPRLLIPFSSIGACLVEFVIGLVLLGGLMSWYQVVPGPEILLLPVLALLTAVTAMAVGLFFSALGVWYRDVRYGLPFLLRIAMYLSPVLYPVTIIPQQFRWLLHLNPLAGIIDGFRYCLFGQPVSVSTLLLSAATAILGFLFSAFYFRRTERVFADMI